MMILLISLWLFCQHWNRTVMSVKTWDGNRADWVFAFTYALTKVMFTWVVIALFAVLLMGA